MSASYRYGLLALIISQSAMGLNQIEISPSSINTIASTQYHSSGASSTNIRIKTADMDGDGDQDIIYAANIYSGRGLEIGWLENNAAGMQYKTSFTKHVIHDAANFYHFEVIDFDKDGDLDVVGATKKTTQTGVISPYQGAHIWWFKNDGSENFSREIISDEIGGNQLAIGDFNGDGKNDLVSANANQALLWTQGEAGSFTSSVITEGEGLSLELAATINANADQFPDVLIAGTAYFRLFINQQDNTFSEETIARKQHCSRSSSQAPFDRCISYEPYHIQIEDIDKDGDDDVGLGNAGYFSSGISWLEQTETFDFNLHHFSAESGEENYEPVWIDMDNDGDIDIAFAYRDATVSWVDNEPTWGWYENRAQPGQTPEYARHGLGYRIGNSGIGIADFNGDGSKEFVLSSYTNITLHEPVAPVQLSAGFHRFGIDDDRLIKATGDDSQILTLSVDHGRLSLASAEAITFLNGDGEADTNIRVSGTSEQLSNALNGLLYQPDNNYFGQDQLNITLVDDEGTDTAILPLWVLGVGAVIDAPKHFNMLAALEFSINFTEPVSGLDRSDFQVSGGALSLDSLMVDSENEYRYIASLTPVTFNDILLQLPSGVASGAYNAKNTPANILLCQPDSSLCGAYSEPANAQPETPDGQTPEENNEADIPELATTSSGAVNLVVATAKQDRDLNSSGFSVSGSVGVYTDHVDLDGDGDLDVVTGIWGGISNGGLQWLENTGQNKLEHPSFSRHILETGVNTLRHYPVDLDKDGDMDLVAVTQRKSNAFISQRQDRLAWFENTASENDGQVAFVKHIIENLEGGGSVKVSDINADGKLDLLVGSRLGAKVRYQSVNEDGSLNFVDRIQTLFTAPSNNYQDYAIHLEALDLNNDDKIDVAMIGQNLFRYWKQQEGLDENNSPLFEEVQTEYSYRNPNAPYQASALVSGDLNADGWVDLISAGNSSSDSLFHYMNDQQGGFDVKELVTGRQIQDAKLRDVDRDGDLDILWASLLQLPSQANWMENTHLNDDQVPQWQTHRIATLAPYSVDSADLNGDGVNDWIMGHKWYNGAVQAQRAQQLIALGDQGQGYNISVSHANENQVLQLELSVNQGTLTLGQFDNLVLEVGDGRDDSAITIRGYAADINNALANLIYAMDASFSGQSQLTIKVNDGQYSRQQTLAFNVLAVDLQITGDDHFDLNSPFTVKFEFTSAVSNFTVQDIAISGSANSIVSGSFQSLQEGRVYQAQILPLTEEDLLIQVAPGAAVNGDQAQSAGALALFCAQTDCQFASGNSDTQGRFPQAGEVPAEDNEPNGETPDEGGSGEDTTGGKGSNAGPDEQTSNEQAMENSNAIPAAKSKSGGGGLAYLLPLLALLMLRRTLRAS